jgi:hypothetical protein
VPRAGLNPPDCWLFHDPDPRFLASRAPPNAPFARSKLQNDSAVSPEHLPALRTRAPLGGLLAAGMERAAISLSWPQREQRFLLKLSEQREHMA